MWKGRTRSVVAVVSVLSVGTDIETPLVERRADLIGDAISAAR
jgi:hypothetical protein